MPAAGATQALRIAAERYPLCEEKRQQPDDRQTGIARQQCFALTVHDSQHNLY